MPDQAAVMKFGLPATFVPIKKAGMGKTSGCAPTFTFSMFDLL
jgi:hypothetical protein